MLRGLPKRDREVLTRFYLQEQSAEGVCRDLKRKPSSMRSSLAPRPLWRELGRRRFLQRSGFRSQ